MKQLDYRSQEFLDLQEEWYKRLGDSGFKDIEAAGHLKRYSNGAFKGVHTMAEYEDRLQYYQKLRECVELFRLEIPAERITMEMRADGCTVLAISAALRALRLRPYCREKVRYIIRQYEHSWGIRSWSLDKLTRPKKVRA